MLDLAWNQIGLEKDVSFGTLFGEAVTQCEIKHLDISYNQIKAEVMEAFAQAIFDNHHMWGLHAQGNEGRVDAMGFVHAGVEE